MKLIYTTLPDKKTAESFAETLISERLAGCGNAIPGMTSVYSWKGKIDRADETILLLKTTEDSAEALIRRLGELHPYECPCILTFSADANSAFACWLGEQTGS